VPERLFLFLQLEFPWELGPPDGRYLLRSREAAGPPPPGRAGGKTEAGGAGGAGGPQHVVVLNTLGARSRADANAGRGALALPVLRARRARRPRETTPEPATVPSTRATIIDPVSVSAERQAQAWLKGLDAERGTRAATAVLNRVLYAHRIATADPHTHEVAPAQALVIRAGWGEGEQLADGRWGHALELPWAPTKRAQRRAAALRPQERLAELLGARTRELLCEELALRARLDLDQGRLTHAAVELDAALAAALGELDAEANPALAPRLDELRALRPGVSAVAQATLPGTSAATGAGDPPEPDEDAVRHALERLEAALRARTASGLTGRGRPGNPS
jgi:hypothetical protein